MFEPQKMTATKSGDEIVIDYSHIGWVAGLGVGESIIQHALELDNWKPVSECSLEYVDPGVDDSLPPYIRAGVWDEDFERTNKALNDLPYLVKDEKIVSYKTKELFKNNLCIARGGDIPYNSNLLEMNLLPS